MSDGTTTEVARGRRHIIKRPRLTRLLDETNARIIMLVAPAGYGKTTLAREWLSSGGRQASWYFGGEASQDVAALARGIATSAAHLVAKPGRRLSDFLLGSAAPEDEPETLAGLAIEDLSPWSPDAWLVIDDYHTTFGSAASENFIEELTRADLQLLITSRQRPSWATARRLLYGDVAEVGATALAMDHHEVSAMLGGRGAAQASGLMALSGGWPAVIGLASLNPDAGAPEADIPTALHDFFAEEMFQAASQPLRDSLTALSLVQHFGPHLHDLLGDEAARLLEEAESLGFLTARPDGREMDLHPLLRIFLRQKLCTHPSRQQLLESVVDYLLASAAWDEAFALIQEFDQFDLLDRLLESSLQTLLEESRYSTLARWVAFARAKDRDSPALDLVDAELALRRGLLRNAQTLSFQVRKHLKPGHPLLARCLIVAGRAAHMASDERTAYEAFDLAARSATSQLDRADALWARYLCGCELELPNCNQLLADFERGRTPTFDDEVRLLTGRSFLQTYGDGVARFALDPVSTLDLAGRIRNPMVRSSFLNRQVWTLLVLGRYDDGARVADEHLEQLRAARLDFALAHALLLKASCELGLRRFELTDTTIADAFDRGQFVNDPYVLMNCAVLRARLNICRQRFHQAKAFTTDIWHEIPNRALHGEYRAMHALALCCLDETQAARSIAEEVLRATNSLEACTLAACTVAVASLRGGSTAEVDPAFELVQRRGNVDSLVTAYRGYPQLLASLAEKPERQAFLRTVVHRAHDERLAAEVHVPLSDLRTGLSKLSPREDEILGLLAEGLTNREIASRLYISEATVKVHLRHIFDKLNVRTRTEAALQIVRRNA